MENLAFDPEKYYLGKLCCRGHKWQDSGKSLRLNGDMHCVSCRQEYSRSRSEYGKQWYKENRDRIREAHKQYRHENRERELNRHKLYREQNHEKIRQSNQKYYQDNRAAVYERGRKRRARKAKNHLAPYSQVELCQHFERFGNECVYCGIKGKLGIDHVVAISNGGPDCLGNIVSCCRRCNSSKLNRDVLTWYKSQEFYSASRWKKILKVLCKTEANLGQLPLF